VSRLLRLYPATWRERYAEEVADLLAARPPSLADRLDLIRGAADAWRHPQVVRTGAGAGAEDRGRGSVTATIPAVLGGGAWAAGGVAMRASQTDEWSTVAWLLLVLGALLTGLAACASERSLARRSPAVAICTACMALFALLMLVPWPVLVLGFFGYLIATIVFGGALVADEARPIGVVLAIAAGAMFAFNTENHQALVAVPFGIIWILIGLVTLRTRFVGERAPAGA
jgi:hypothetical protein